MEKIYYLKKRRSDGSKEEPIAVFRGRRPTMSEVRHALRLHANEGLREYLAHVLATSPCSASATVGRYTYQLVKAQPENTAVETKTETYWLMKKNDASGKETHLATFWGVPSMEVVFSVLNMDWPSPEEITAMCSSNVLTSDGIHIDGHTYTLVKKPAHDIMEKDPQTEEYGTYLCECVAWKNGHRWKVINHWPSQPSASDLCRFLENHSGARPTPGVVAYVRMSGISLNGKRYNFWHNKPENGKAMYKIRGPEYQPVCWWSNTPTIDDIREVLPLPKYRYLPPEAPMQFWTVHEGWLYRMSDLAKNPANKKDQQMKKPDDRVYLCEIQDDDGIRWDVITHWKEMPDTEAVVKFLKIHTENAPINPNDMYQLCNSTLEIGHREFAFWHNRPRSGKALYISGQHDTRPVCWWQETPGIEDVLLQLPSNKAVTIPAVRTGHFSCECGGWKYHVENDTNFPKKEADNGKFWVLVGGDTWGPGTIVYTWAAKPTLREVGEAMFGGTLAPAQQQAAQRVYIGETLRPTGCDFDSYRLVELPFGTVDLS